LRGTSSPSCSKRRDRGSPSWRLRSPAGIRPSTTSGARGLFVVGADPGRRGRRGVRQGCQDPGARVSRRVAVERTASTADPRKVTFPRAYLSRGSLDFSFSGLKTSVALFVKKWKEEGEAASGITMAEIAASFQDAVVEVLAQKTREACGKDRGSSIVVAGGVACNKALRERMLREAPDGCGSISQAVLLHGQRRDDRTGRLSPGRRRQDLRSLHGREIALSCGGHRAALRKG